MNLGPEGRPQASPGPIVRFSVLLAVVVTLLAAPAAAGPSVDLASLIARADELRLHEAPRWRALLHYRPDRFGGGVTSLVTAQKFFLATDGRTNPRAELIATIEAFVESPRVAEADRSPRCVFPARYRWLGRRLGLDAGSVPEPHCPALDEWLEAIGPHALSLIFPEGYMNNPSSMFGHTLLRIDRADDEHDLLTYAINFAAHAGNDGGVSFAFKGVFGFYDGFFSLLPYYEKLKQYGDWENRDIWEYRLDFSPDEVAFVVLHVWELRGIPFRYYFFDDNCSYQVLRLLEVGRPRLTLSGQFPAWVIPVDTVRAVADVDGLVTTSEYRPSPATRLRHRARTLPPSVQVLALELARGERAPDDEALSALSPEERARVLTLAYDYLRYLYLDEQVMAAESRPRSRALLVARSRIAAVEADADRVPVPPVRAGQGHPPAFVAAGGGWQGEDYFVAARLRPHFHSLLDPSGGYTAGAQIRVLDVTLQLFPEREVVRLDELVLLDITSLTARNRFLKPLSWRVATGIETRPTEGRSGDLGAEGVWRSEGGAGVAYDVGSRALAYGLAAARVDFAPTLDDHVAFGPGATVGLLARSSSDRWKSHLFAEVTGFVLGDDTTSTRVGLDNRLVLSERTAAVLELGYEHAYGDDWFEARLMWQLYFRRRYGDR